MKVVYEELFGALKPENVSQQQDLFNPALLAKIRSGCIISVAVDIKHHTCKNCIMECYNKQWF